VEQRVPDYRRRRRHHDVVEVDRDDLERRPERAVLGVGLARRTQRIALEIGKRRAPPDLNARRAMKAHRIVEHGRDRDDVGAGRSRPPRAGVELDRAARLVCASAHREVASDPAVDV
jgi:hypothetical protein